MFLIRDDRIVCRAARIAHHFEWDKAMTPRDVIDKLFTDIDADGKPELVERDIGKNGGPVIYHEFVGTAFFPSWIEEYQPDRNNKIKRISSTDLKVAVHCTANGGDSIRRIC